MDEIVAAALRKWPDVPACRGWLGLDARGDWYLRDDRVQAAGPFPQAKGSRLQHDRLIGRNYGRDGRGCWFFQNGPQRVHVELEAAPWIWRVDATGALTSHTGQVARAGNAWLDERGRLFVDSDLGLGLVHTLDMHAAAQVVESGRWQPQPMAFAAMAGRFGHVLSPQAEAAAST
jgi:hypothetical protein